LAAAFTSRVNREILDYQGNPEARLPTGFEDHIALDSNFDPSTMHCHQEMKKPDQQQFIKAMEGEVSASKIASGSSFPNRISVRSASRY